MLITRIFTLFFAVNTLLLEGCMLRHPAWTYLDPPKLNDYFNLAEKTLWCDSKPGAQYSAITGWIGPDCYDDHLAAHEFRVIGLTHEVFGTTKVIVVHCQGKNGEIWIPLPSHLWA